MREKRFPGVAQAVAPVCLGTAQFGDSTGESQAFAVLDGYAAAGGNFIDTANCYGKWLPAGENVSEQILGRWLRSRGGRHSMVISTKGGHPPFSDMHASRLHEREVDAQAHPEEYKDLIVRVAGYSDHFRNLSRALQDEIIARTEQSFA